MTALLKMIGGIFIECDKPFPVDIVLVRASEIPSLVSDERSSIKAGLTGSDILWEAGLGKNAGLEIPVYRVYPWNEEKQPTLYLGMAYEFVDSLRDQQNRAPTAKDLEGNMLATKLPRIARDYLSEKGIENVEIREVGGTDEAMQYVYPNCYSTLGVTKTGRTVEDNDIVVVDAFYPVTVRWIRVKEKLNEWEEYMLEDLENRLLYGGISPVYPWQR